MLQAGPLTRSTSKLYADVNQYNVALDRVAKIVGFN